MRVALLAHSARSGDAVGNQVAARAAFFRERAADVRVYVETDARLHADLLSFTQVVATDLDGEAILTDLLQSDLIVVEYSQAYRLLDVLPRVAGRGPRILFDYHGVTPPKFWHGPPEALREGQKRRGLVWFADEAAVHSEFMKRELCEATGFPTARVYVLPLLFDLTRLQTNDPSRRLRQRLALTDERLLLFVGRLAPNKRVPVLIDAVAKLKDQQPAIHAAIVGDSGDVYRAELKHCQDLANQLDVTDRVHFLGHVDENDLVDAYRSADLFVMPSLHEGCCIPILEAMAAGVPVIAARAAALPETIAGAGLTCAPDDADDLARQIRRVTEIPRDRPSGARSVSEGAPDTLAYASGSDGPTWKLAIVSPSCGENALGGAERSLRLIADVLAESGHRVDLMTNEPANPSSFDAIIVGPYCCELAAKLATIAPDRTILVPCFHDEPLARQPEIATRFTQVAGVLYHSESERRLAENDLGINHPNSAVIGTWIDSPRGDTKRGQKLIGRDRPYLLYCGRFCNEKNLPLLVDWLKQYESEHSDQFTIVFIGGGELQIPDNPNWRNLGFVSERNKADLLAGASALIQLSTNESLSLVALEAWNEGTPVIVHSNCPVMREHLEAGGGRAVANYEQFRDSLNDLLQNAHDWQEMGRRGREYVANRYHSHAEFAQRINEVLAAMNRPIADLMRERGLEATRGRDDEAWKLAFSERVESVLHREPVELKFAVVIRPRHGDSLRARPGARRTGIRLENTGAAPLLAEDCRIRARVLSVNGEPDVTRLAEMLLPGRSCPLAIRLDVPIKSGEYLIELEFERDRQGAPMETVRLPLHVEPAESNRAAGADSLLDELMRKLAEAESLAELPAGYTDVSEGALGSLKRTIKQKLLHQFQTAYVDVLSRQQSAMNRVMLEAIQELSECLAMLGQPTGDQTAGLSDATGQFGQSLRQLKARVRDATKRLDDVDERLKRLEATSARTAIE